METPVGKTQNKRGEGIMGQFKSRGRRLNYNIVAQWFSYPDLVQLEIYLDDSEVEDGDGPHEDKSKTDDTDEYDNGRTGVIHELPTHCAEYTHIDLRVVLTDTMCNLAEI